MKRKIKDGLHFQHNTIVHRDNDNSYLSKSGSELVLTCIFSGPDCAMQLDDTQYAHEIQFAFHDDFLKTFSPEETGLSLQHFPDYQQHDICCTTQMILHDIITCKLNGAFHNMFLASKALDLLLCFQKCNSIPQSDCDSCKFLTSKIEKDKFLKAREIIMESLSNPPTIPELSFQIGINQCYLKKGFKEVFGSTVYDFVQEQRMQKARMLLRTTRHTVAQVAEMVGFSSQSSFSSAFKRHTGVLPSELQQS